MAAKLKLAQLTLTRVRPPLVALEQLVASSGWLLVPEVLRTPAEDTIRILSGAEVAALAVVHNQGRGELRVADAKSLTALVSDAKKSGVLAQQVMKTLSKT